MYNYKRTTIRDILTIYCIFEALQVYYGYFKSEFISWLHKSGVLNYLNKFLLDGTTESPIAQEPKEHIPKMVVSLLRNDIGSVLYLCETIKTSPVFVYYYWACS